MADKRIELALQVYQRLKDLAKGSKSIDRTVGEFDPRFARSQSDKELERLSNLNYGITPYNRPEVKNVNLSEIKGRPLILHQSDRTSAEGLVDRIGDVTLNRPVPLQAGSHYGNIGDGRVWESAETPINQIVDAVGDFTGKDPAIVNFLNIPSNSDFGHINPEVMLSYAQTTFNKGQKKALDKDIRKIIPGWKGLDDEENIVDLFNASSDQRKALQTMLHKVPGGIKQSDARLITADPRFHNIKDRSAPLGGLSTVDRGAGVSPGGHGTYPFGIRGDFKGQLTRDDGSFINAFELLDEYKRGDTPYIFKSKVTGELDPKVESNWFTTKTGEKRLHDPLVKLRHNPAVVPEVTDELIELVNKTRNYAGGGAALPIKLTKELIEAWKKKNILPKKNWLSQQPMKKELTQGLKDLEAGKINADDWANLVKQYDAPRPYDAVPGLTSLEDLQGALTPNKLEKGVIGLDATIPEGMKVGTRLDIPAYDQYQKWVNSFHGKFGKEGKTGVKYGQASHLVKGKDSKIKLNPHSKEAFGIAAHGKAKAPFAQIQGNWKNTKPEDIKKMADEALKDKSWTQIGFNPKRAGYYFDRNTFEPIVDADEILQIGPLVLGKNVGKAKPTDEIFKIKGSDINFKEGGEASDAEKFKLAEDSYYSTPIKRGLAMIGTGFGDLAHMAVSNLPLSQYGTVNIPEEDFFGTTKYAEKNWGLPKGKYDLLSDQGGLELATSLLGPAGIIKAVGVKGLGPLSKILKEKK